MTNLMIPEELAPLVNFNWSQFSDTYVQDTDIVPQGRTAR